MDVKLVRNNLAFTCDLRHKVFKGRKSSAGTWCRAGGGISSGSSPYPSRTRSAYLQSMGLRPCQHSTLAWQAADAGAVRRLRSRRSSPRRRCMGVTQLRFLAGVAGLSS